MAEIDESPRSSELVSAGSGGEQELVVRCLLMPFSGFNVLIPNTAVAEVIGYEEPHMDAVGPAWLKGFVVWRGVKIPVVSFEKLVGHTEGHLAEHARLIIFNALGGSGNLPFIAMTAQGLPRLVALKDANLHHVPGEKMEVTGVYVRLLLDGNAVIVPDLEVIEKMLVQAGVVGAK